MLDPTPTRTPELWWPLPGSRTDMPTVGSRFGVLQLEAILRRGCVSQTFQATHLKFGISVAVKIIPVEGLPEADSLRSMLKTEAIALARLNHPNIVRLWDVETEGPFPHLITEYVGGYTVAELINRIGSLQPLLAIGLARQAVEGLTHAHTAKVIHRDVNPSNMVVGRDGVLKLLDFGLALVEGASARSVPDNPDTGSCVAGTAAYLAPEQAKSPESVDFRADIYSLGATLYHALTGCLPFKANSAMEMITKHLREEVVSPDMLNPEVSDEVAAVVVRMLAKQPRDRFLGYDELRAALTRAVGDRRLPCSQAEAIMAFAPEIQ